MLRPFIPFLLILLWRCEARPQQGDQQPIPISKDSTPGRPVYKHVPSEFARANVEQTTQKPRRRHRHRRPTYDDAYEKQMEQWREQRREADKARKAQYDQYYQQYFDRMRQYAVNVHVNRYGQLLKQQEDEKVRFAKNMEEFGLRSSALGVDRADTDGSEVQRRPSSPFGGITEKSQLDQTRAKAADVRGVMMKRPPSAVEPRPEDIDVHRKALHLEALCNRFLPTVRKHCFGGNKTDDKYGSKCKGYFHDCQRFLPKSDPLYNIAYAFDSNVGLNLGTWDVKGIPYYPINEEGAIGAGRQMNIPFGSWGGGYSDHIGVRDYWSQYQEIGANWYEGKYGYKSGWSVPLVQSLGIEGDTHAVVSVPLKPGEAGKPIGVDVGGGVGPYYQQNQHVGVDYLNGQVGTNLGVGVPMAGVAVNTGVGVTFPGVNDILGKKKKK
ncbi:unnamed protein product [Caenorhabditis sp. 36 PRJEB53466]|nr:unnamed protein product [Caenorhabditis sp. 36 PRJEB53466]